MTQSNSLGRKSGGRIGIYSGTFDPVHAGHIAFALKAIRDAQLDMIYFLPERHPRYKPTVTDFTHRISMLKTSLHEHAELEVLTLEDANFSVHSTLAHLQGIFLKSSLVFLFGSDLIPHISSWPNSGQLFTQTEVCVGLREGATAEDMLDITGTWKVQPQHVYIVASQFPTVSSMTVRQSLQEGVMREGVLPNTQAYSLKHHLYNM